MFETKTISYGGAGNEFWGDTSELTDKQKRQRSAAFKKKAPFLLCIHTDSYAGNFERELVAYSIGILDDVQMKIEHSTEYIKAFWNGVEGPGCDSYEDYKNILSRIVKKELEEKKQIPRLENSYVEFYHETLCPTYQYVDDWEQTTFYYIDKYYKEEKEKTQHPCNCVYIQLNHPLSDGDVRMERILIDRIKDFEKAYKIIDLYQQLCNCGEVEDVCPYDSYPSILGIELISQKKELIKDYMN